MQLYGFLFASGSILAFGSAGMPLKLKCVTSLDTFRDNRNDKGVHPGVFHIYLLIGIFLSSLLLYSFVEPRFDGEIVLAAFLQSVSFIPANIAAIAAIQFIGIVTAISIWSGMTIIVSFIWGVTAFADANVVNNALYCTIALILLVLGVTNFVVAFRLSGDNSADFNWKGIICAVAVGILNGTLLVPMQWLNDTNDAGFALNVTAVFSMFNMVLGGLVIITWFSYMRWHLKNGGWHLKNGGWTSLPNWHLKNGGTAGIIVGITWQIGNVCSVYATLFLGISLGFPLAQLALIVNALLGIILFRELRGAISIIIFIGAIASLLMGAVLLSDSLNEGIVL